MQKKLLISAVAILILLGGIIFVWQKKNEITNQSKTKNTPIQNETILSEKEKADKYAWNWDGSTSNWKVYVNEDSGFLLRYPEEVFNFRIMPISGSVGVYSKPLPPKEFRIALTQKGYPEDDYAHQIWMDLNSLKSEQEYRSESQKDTDSVSVLFGSKLGRMYGAKESVSKLKVDYESFLKDGICNAETLTITFDDIKNPNGDVRSYVHIGCEGKDMGKIYRAVYQSIKFFELKD